MVERGGKRGAAKAEPSGPRRGGCGKSKRTTEAATDHEGEINYFRRTIRVEGAVERRTARIERRL